MPTPSELLHANLYDVFNERNPDRRRAAIENFYAEDVVFTDPEGTQTGWDAVGKAAESLLARVPTDFSFQEAGPKYLGGDTAALSWTLGPADQPVARGLDILTIRDGRVVAIKTILEITGG
ncbi:nuclear transport factor 2 family protein [Lacisediminihabitans sp. FW035]